MSLRYVKICHQPILFQRLFGISPQAFKIIFEEVHPRWQESLKASYKRPGRNFKLSLEDMLLMLLLYYRSYITQTFVGYLFGIDDSNVCRIIRKLEPLLAKVIKIQKERVLKQEEVESLIIDATEQPCERPSRDQKLFYSGKKKRHTLKTEIQLTLSGRIVHVSKTKPGSIHDFALHKQETPVHKDSRVFVDSGYQGLDKRHLQTELPYKSSKKKSLDKEEKEYNRALSRIRVKAENVFAQIKTFKILSDRYRNKRKRYNLKFNIIAGLVNMKNGFRAA